MSGKLLLVIPPIVRLVNGMHEVEVDFANNLKLYLRNFTQVTFACPILLSDKNSGILSSLPFSKIQNNEKLSYIPLPYTYREDRHLHHYLKTRKLLRSEIVKADYLLFSPHAMFDWPTLAALQAIKMKRKYDLESDWDHESVQRLNLAAIPPGINKIRKTIWMHLFLRTVNKCMRHSTLALLQGQDVFNAYKDVAPNPHKVLNVQVSPGDYIPAAQLEEKLAHIEEGKPLTISYAGRMIPMKGPLDWLKIIQGTVKQGADLHATWFGDGSLMAEMRRGVEKLGIEKEVTLAGIVGREEVMTVLRKTDIFLFCHMTGESPRCLGEALAAGCALVGYSTAYSRELVGANGGGEFAEINNWQALTEIITSLDRNRPNLSHLVESAAASGKLLNRDAAMQNRIDLIKKYLAA